MSPVWDSAEDKLYLMSFTLGGNAHVTDNTDCDDTDINVQTCGGTDTGFDTGMGGFDTGMGFDTGLGLFDSGVSDSGSL